MAHASWLKKDKTSGSGNSTVQFWTEQPYYGRVARSATQVTFSADSGTSTLTQVVTVTQKARPEYIDMDATKTVAKSGGTITISGVSNTSKITFSLLTVEGYESIGLTAPVSYNVGGTSVGNGAEIAGDPGATDKFNFSVQFTVPENTSINEKRQQLKAVDNAGNIKYCLISQGAGEATLTVSPLTVEIDAEGTHVSVSVISNTSWTVQ